MQPPIASPFEPARPDLPVTKRVEWDAERECFVLRYKSPFRGRLRCEIYAGLRNPLGFLGVTVGLPVLALLLAATTKAQDIKSPSQLSVYRWGIEDAAIGMIFKTEWSQLKRAFVRQDDFFIRRAPVLIPYCYFCREDFADQNEAARLCELVESLRAQNGANWEEVVRQFRT